MAEISVFGLKVIDGVAQVSAILTNTNIAQETGGNLATIATNTANIAQETGGNLALLATNVGTGVYSQLIAADETLTTNSVSLNTGVHRLVDIYATATTATTFTVDISMDNTNWVNYYTSAAAEAKYTSTIWSGFKYVKLSAAVSGVSGTDTTTLILGSK